MTALNLGSIFKLNTPRGLTTLNWLVRVVAVIALLAIASKLWGGSHERQASENTVNTKLFQEGSLNTGVPDAAEVFRNNTAAPEDMPLTF